MRRLFFFALLIAIAPSLAAATRKLTLTVTYRGKPAKSLVVEYHDVEDSVSNTTDSRGVVVFRVHSKPRGPLPYLFSLESPDFVLTNLQGRDYQWSVEATRSAAWRQKTHPRPCDEWSRVMDIPRGALPMQSAEEYDQWYASLSPQSVQNCVALTVIERKVGSKAPWYFYEFKSMPSACVDGKYGNELDWTAWYRRLLEEAAKASPGKCVSDWERWWRGKGYPPIPDQPREQAP